MGKKYGKEFSRISPLQHISLVVILNWSELKYLLIQIPRDREHSCRSVIPPTEEKANVGQGLGRPTLPGDRRSEYAGIGDMSESGKRKAHTFLRY